MSDFDKKQLIKSKIWLIDGTFYTAPRQFSQVIVIHGFLFGKTFPLVYVLAGSKKEILYKKIFSFLKSIIIKEPKRIIIDFEMGLLNALSFCFGTSMITGCLFHFSQAIWRKLQNLDYQEIYSVQTVQTYIRLFIDLAFIPSYAIQLEYEKISAIQFYVEDEFKSSLRNFIEYFEKTYIINENINNFKKSPLYNHSFGSYI
jgi:hypothetical protein